MKIYTILLIIALNTGLLNAQAKPQVCLSFDDSNCKDTPIYGWKQKNQKILETLGKYHLQAILFVEGKLIDSPDGAEVLKSWDDQGHLLGNHSYSHYYYNSPMMSFDKYSSDFLRCDSIIRQYNNYARLYRFPFLKEGETKDKRDSFRLFMKSMNYSNGCVTIDASDWYVDDRLSKRLKSDSLTDIKPYGEFYCRHIYERAQYYDELSKKVFGRSVKHCLLLHHNMINALFLEDLISMFQSKGWEVIKASEAFSDQVYSMEPDLLPAGESIIWSAARISGKLDNELRYPAEDGEYEKEKMDKLGL